MRVDEKIRLELEDSERLDALVHRLKRKEGRGAVSKQSILLEGLQMVMQKYEEEEDTLPNAPASPTLTKAQTEALDLFLEALTAKYPADSLQRDLQMGLLKALDIFRRLRNNQ